MASEAETRIRIKAERLLRDLYPDARIIHEFEVGGARLDLAAVTPDRLILVEIKSEKDTLTRLDNQTRRSLRIGGPFILCAAARWRDQLSSREGLGLRGYRAECLIETDDGFEDIAESPRWPAYWRTRLSEADRDRYDSRALLGLMLKPEMLAMAKPHGAKARFDVSQLCEIAHEHLTGREIRRGVLTALRRRHFGWTCDAPDGGREIQSADARRASGGGR